MVKASIENGILQDFIGQATPLMDEARLHFEEGELWMSGVDPADVGMVDTSLSADAFESYGSDGTVIGVNINRLEDVLDMGGRKSTTSLATEDGHTLKITADGVEYTLACTDTASIRSEPEMPDLELPNEFEVEWNHIEQGITAGKMVSDHITIEGDTEGAVLIRAAGDTDDVVKRLVDELQQLNIGEDASSIYSLDFMECFSRGVPDSDTQVAFYHGQNFPLRMEFGYADGHGDCVFIVAPRIES
jgi:proliferating cell nuclear antigen